MEPRANQREYFTLTSLGTEGPILIGLARTNCNLLVLYNCDVENNIQHTSCGKQQVFQDSKNVSRQVAALLPTNSLSTTCRVKTWNFFLRKIKHPTTCPTLTDRWVKSLATATASGPTNKLNF